jgi:hypothetical protein
MCVAIHMCMQAMLGIPLYSYFYLKLEKHYVFLIISYVFSSTKSENKRVEQILPRSRDGGVGREERRRGEVAQTMYTHVSKCKNGKIKESK